MLFGPRVPNYESGKTPPSDNITNLDRKPLPLVSFCSEGCLKYTRA